MKKVKANIHRGQVLKDAVEATRMNKEEVAKKAGYTRASYYKHVQERDLAFHILASYGKAIHYDFTEEFPEMPKYMIEEPEADYSKDISVAEALKQRDYWKDKYIELLEKYNRLIEEKVRK